MATQHDYQKDIKQLNSFLRDEKAAVETYQQCIEKLDDADVAARLTSLQKSHMHRVGLLSDRVHEIGGTPEDGSGIWGGFAKLVEGGAKIFGQKSALAALEEGEDRGLHNYEEEINHLAPENESFIKAVILPEQKRSHDELNRIRDSVY